MLNTDKADFQNHADFSADLSDSWTEETDPENDLGEDCRGFFEMTDFDCILIGLRVTGDDYSDFYTREQAINLLTFETVCRIENVLQANREESSDSDFLLDMEIAETAHAGLMRRLDHLARPTLELVE